jgi:hypothetical protein
MQHNIISIALIILRIQQLEVIYTISMAAEINGILNKIL